MEPGELEVLRILYKSNEPVSHVYLNSRGLVGDAINLVNKDLVEVVKMPLHKSDDGVRGDFYPKASYYQLNDEGKNYIKRKFEKILF